MKSSKKYIFHFICVIIISILQTTTSFATTEFQLFTNGIDNITYCDYVEIKDNHIICSDNNFLVTYNIDQIKKLEFVSETESFSVYDFTELNIKKINTVNLNKINSKKTIHTSKSNNSTKQLSFNSFKDFAESLKAKCSHLIANNTLSVIIQLSGLIILLIGSIWYIIETFRVGILWGLSCMFLPFVSFIFLFVHWKVASKPFLLSILGLAISFSGSLLTDSFSQTAHTAQSSSVPLIGDNNYKCSGKKYCSEMTSCKEAKFYLRHCQGTKIDGNHDGIPCEKQWCN